MCTKSASFASLCLTWWQTRWVDVQSTSQDFKDFWALGFTHLSNSYLLQPCGAATAHKNLVQLLGLDLRCIIILMVNRARWEFSDFCRCRRVAFFLVSEFRTYKTESNIRSNVLDIVYPQILFIIFSLNYKVFVILAISIQWWER